jgi:peptidoglycan/LPS O-acetylase OafA/YrhL
MPRHDALTGLRGLLAVLIVFVHSDVLNVLHIPQLYRTGGMFVSAFFVMSGMLMALTYKDCHCVKLFWWKRFARVYPLYALSLLATLYDVTECPSTWQNSITAVLTLFGLQGLSPNNNTRCWNGVAWSLSVEFFDYFLFPFLNRSPAKYRLGTLLVAVIMAACMPAYKVLVYPDWRPDILFRSWDFLAAMSWIRVVNYTPDVMWRGVPDALFMGLVAMMFFGSNAFCDWASQGGLALVWIVAVISLLNDQQPSLIRWTLSTKPFVWLGDISIAVYLFHAPVIHAWIEVTEISEGWWLLVMVVVILIVSWFIHVCIEVPLHRWLVERSPWRCECEADTSLVVVEQPFVELLPTSTETVDRDTVDEPLEWEFGTS